jgi:hypothetical protein|tara:strand:- start:123 stop:329 length:207 start_codon:yes stop_codon:yes gene_type:complete
MIMFYPRKNRLFHQAGKELEQALASYWKMRTKKPAFNLDFGAKQRRSDRKGSSPVQQNRARNQKNHRL